MGTSINMSRDDFKNFPVFLERITEKARLDGRGLVIIRPEWKMKKWDIEKLNDEVIDYDVQMKEKVSKGVYQLKIAENESGEISIRDYFKDQQTKKFSKDLDREIWENFAGYDKKYDQKYDEIYGTHRDPKAIKGDRFLLYPGCDPILNHLRPWMPGVHEPYLYFGRYKTFFGKHFENAKLNSISILHFGAPKVWYGIHSKDNGKLLAAMESK
jgi:hypothetical protein